MTWELVPSSFEFAKNQAQDLLENETWKWKQTTYIRYLFAKLSKFVQLSTQTFSDSFLQKILWKLKKTWNWFPGDIFHVFW